MLNPVSFGAWSGPGLHQSLECVYGNATKPGFIAGPVDQYRRVHGFGGSFWIRCPRARDL